MKVVQINTVYGTGSTGKIVAALYNLSNKEGFDAYVTYGRGKSVAENNVKGILIGDKLDFLSHVLYNFTTGRNGFASKHNTQRFLKWLDEINPDIIHLHNIHGFYIHVGLLFDYIKGNNIPVIWTFHDCWPFTGQCAHFDYAQCNKWQSGCYKCPIYRTNYPYSIFHDNSKNNYLAKRATFTGVQNLTIVTPSTWLANLAQNSFLKEYPVTTIQNGINLEVFSPNAVKSNQVSSSVLASIKEISRYKILLGVASVWDNLKGLDYMLKLSTDFNKTNGYQIVLIGLNKKQCKTIQRKYSDKIIAIERTNNQYELATWYSSAYVYINPTLQDTFPTTNLEALACGTPVITFNTGGSPESLSSTCGIVVPKGDYTKLKGAISHLETAPITSEECIKQSKLFDQDIAFSQYINLYKSVFS